MASTSPGTHSTLFPRTTIYQLFFITSISLLLCQSKFVASFDLSMLLSTAFVSTVAFKQLYQTLYEDNKVLKNWILPLDSLYGLWYSLSPLLLCLSKFVASFDLSMLLSTAFVSTVEGQRHYKHNSLVNLVAEECSSHLFSLRKEVSVDDIVLQNWQNGRDLYLDFSVISSLCPSYCNAASLKAGAAAAIRTDEKFVKYRALSSSIWFSPVSVEALGGWDPLNNQLFKKIASRMAESGYNSASDSLKHLMNKLSVRLQKMNGEMLALRCLEF